MRIFCALIFSLASLAVVAQDVQQDTDDNRVKQPKLAVKWSPVHLAYFYPSFQVAVEHKIFKDLSIQYDGGVILDYGNNDSDEYSNKRGFRVLGELRYYIPSPPKIPFYVAVEGYYNNIQFERSEVVGYDCYECAYYENVTYKVENRQQGVGLKYGILLFPGWNKQRSFFFDINLGLAYRSITYTDFGRPQGENITRFDNDVRYFDFGYTPNEKDRNEFRFILGVRLGYRIF